MQHFLINSLFNAPTLSLKSNIVWKLIRAGYKVFINYLKDPCESNCLSHSGKSLMSFNCDWRGNASNIDDWNNDFKSNLVSNEDGEWKSAFVENICSICWRVLLANRSFMYALKLAWLTEARLWWFANDDEDDDEAIDDSVAWLLPHLDNLLGLFGFGEDCFKFCWVRPRRLVRPGLFWLLWIDLVSSFVEKTLDWFINSTGSLFFALSIWFFINCSCCWRRKLSLSTR